MASSQSSQMTGSSSSFAGLSTSDQASVRALIAQLLGGGTPDYQALRAKRMANMADLQALARDYTNEAAFSDAAALMELNLQQSMEKQMPAIAKAVQGAGTSASSMQALMSNKIAQDAALGAGALGAEQAKAYAAALANMQGTIENYTRGGDEMAQHLVNALGLLRTQTSQSTQQSSSSGYSDSGGGRGSSGGGSKLGDKTGGTTGGWSNGFGSMTGGTILGGGNNGSISWNPSTGSGYDYVNMIFNQANPGDPGFGWSYYDNGTAIDPSGNYYFQGEQVWSPDDTLQWDNINNSWNYDPFGFTSGYDNTGNNYDPVYNANNAANSNYDFWGDYDDWSYNDSLDYSSYDGSEWG